MGYEAEKAACVVEGVIAVLEDMAETADDTRLAACVASLHRVVEMLCQDD